MHLERTPVNLYIHRRQFAFTLHPVRRINSPPSGNICNTACMCVRRILFLSLHRLGACMRKSTRTSAAFLSKNTPHHTPRYLFLTNAHRRHAYIIKHAVSFPPAVIHIALERDTKQKRFVKNRNSPLHLDRKPCKLFKKNARMEIFAQSGRGAWVASKTV